ncbi:MAG: single-stranded DNA-binding protein [Calothrix sp. C42_A2020_038]|nr:single-stranded DNA-binding protein [Calothrix sp. C42_A2020_038]
MNNCILMAEITSQPQLRHTPDGLEISEMMVQFSGTRPDDPPGMLRVIGWGNLAKEIHQNYHQGDRVLLEGRLGMNTIDRPEGFKEKRAELTVQKIHSLDGSVSVSSTSIEKTSTASNFRTNAAPANRPPASNNSPRYDEAPFATPTTTTKSNIGVMPDSSNQYATTQASKNYEPSTYPASQEVETEEDDDIPF